MQTIGKLKSLIQFYKSDIHHIRLGARKNTLHITGASCLANIFIATGKVIVGILSMSIFTCVSAMYTYAIVVAKVYVLYGISQTKDNFAKQYEYYKRSGKLLVIAGIAYMIYSTKLIFFPIISNFNQNTAIAIAFFTFLELGFNIRGMIVERKNKMPLFHALKIINLASSCICLVLTQTALLAYTSTQSGTFHNIGSNGIIGLLMGFFSTLLGIFLIVRSNRITEGKDYKRICINIKRIMRKRNEFYAFEAIQLSIDYEGKRLMFVNFLESIDEISKKELTQIVFNKMNVVIIDKNDNIRKKETMYDKNISC